MKENNLKQTEVNMGKALAVFQSSTTATTTTTRSSKKKSGPKRDSATPFLSKEGGKQPRIMPQGMVMDYGAFGGPALKTV